MASRVCVCLLSALPLHRKIVQHSKALTRAPIGNSFVGDDKSQTGEHVCVASFTDRVQNHRTAAVRDSQTFRMSNQQTCDPSPSVVWMNSQC